jgi:ADP-ribose pyrophosphatase YjhB (NUDIX family)
MSFNYHFCPQCAGPLQHRFTEGRDRLVCENCGFVFYQNPVPAVAVILQQNGKILLVKRKFAPRAGDWSLPAGFIEWGEGPEQTAIREVKEETNLNIAVRDLYGVYPAKDYPDYEILLLVYRGEILDGELQPGDDALEARFFDFATLPENIAFRIHRNILGALKNELAKNAAPVTPRDLHKVYIDEQSVQVQITGRKATIRVSGNLPNPAYKLDHVAITLQDKVIEVTPLAQYDPEKIVAQVLVPFTDTVEVEVPKAGNYAVRVLGRTQTDETKIKVP